MKTALMLWVCFVISVNPHSAQSLRYADLHPYISLSATSTRQDDVFSFTGNQAALAHIREPALGVFGERRYLLPEISMYTLAAAVPTRLGNMGIQIQYAGFKNFRETRAGLAFARALGKRVAVGIQFNYYSYAIPAYGNRATVHFEAGSLFRLSDKLNVGIHVYNPVGGTMGKPDAGPAEKLASVYKLCLGYDASDRFFISTEIIKEEGKPVNVTAGVQYQFARQFYSRAGFAGGTGSVYAGAGISWAGLRLEAASSYHPVLGFSPGILLLMQVKRKAS